MSSIPGKITKFTKKEIDYLFHHARRALKNPAFVILLAPRQLNFGRILIILSKKVGSAPQRNKIRRRIKSLFFEEKYFTTPFDTVVIVHKKATELSFNQIKNIIRDVYHKALAHHAKNSSDE